MTTLRLIGYIRVSDVGGREGERFISPTLQRDRVGAYATAHGYDVVGWQEDLDRSGADGQRPGLLEALDAVERGDADGIAVAKLDRFARSQRVALDTLERLEAAGGVLVSVEESFDTATPLGRAMRSLMIVFAELEREQRRDGLLAADAVAVRRGVHISAFPPVGYVRRDDGRLEPDPVTAPAVHDVFVRRARGAPWEELAAYLDERGVKTSRGQLPTGGFVARMIANPVYLGQARGPGGAVNDDAHTPIVTPPEWEAAQLSKRARPTRRDAALLSELVRCAGCARSLIPANDVYRCKAKYPAGNCPAPAVVNADLIEAHVIERFFAELGDDGPEVDVGGDSAELRAAIEAAEEADRELVSYRDASLVSVIGQVAYTEGLTVRAERLRDTRARLEEAQDAATLGSLLARRVDLIAEWPAMTVAERRSILAEAVDCVVIRPARGTGRLLPIGERSRIFWRGTGPADLPARGRVTPLLSLLGSFDERDSSAGIPPAHHG